jgi:hypothetical protein
VRDGKIHTLLKDILAEMSHLFHQKKDYSHCPSWAYYCQNTFLQLKSFFFVVHQDIFRWEEVNLPTRAVIIEEF